MIEFVVSMQGLLIQNSMHAETMTPATRVVEVMAGTSHPPTFVTSSGGFGFFDQGTYPPGAPDSSWVEDVFGMPVGALVPKRRVNIVDRGSGIRIQIAGTVVELEVRSRDGTRVERRRWAGPADFDVNGAVQQADLDAFMSAYNAGSSKADYNRDGRVTDADRTAFLNAWNTGGPQPCAADLTLDGMLDTADLLLYVNQWFSGLLEADLAEPHEVIDIHDLIEYLNRWFAGC